MAVTTGFHPFALTPRTAGGDPPARRKSVAERFHDHENKIGTLRVGGQADILPGLLGRDVAFGVALPSGLP